ncbi:MAG: hypothetical protein Q8867_02430 [Bacteroidota bacterium]|nr:hypothetical protein [Bacteroidota bacterium]
MIRVEKKKSTGSISHRYFILYEMLFLYFFSVPLFSTAQPVSLDTVRIQKNIAFYDSVYQKLSRHKVTQLLYGLAFIPPENNRITDSTQVILSESPFLPYSGKIIRKIHFLSLSPFGPSIEDTTHQAMTDAGRTMNKMHISTQNYIIREKIFFSKGDPLDPSLMADNERSLREISSFSDVRILVQQALTSEDSVDVTVITKDVWSIGFDIPKLTNNNMSLRIFDANFLGLTDRFSNTLYFSRSHAPFLSYHGGSYTLSNIDGKFIDGQLVYSRDELNSEVIAASAARTFFANTVQWAGGGRIEYDHSVECPEEGQKKIAFYTNLSEWAGRSFLLKNMIEPTRIILTEAANWRNYSARPLVSIDSNRLYYNNTQLLTGISLSRNNYYLSNYILRFGKPENIPYGKVIQVTLGPDITDFYTRFYSGVKIGMGSHFYKIGYFSEFINTGAYFWKNNMEDVIVKGKIFYMSNILYSKNKKFKFRTFLQMNYTGGFLFRNNNKDYTNIGTDIQYPGNEEDSALYGVHSWISDLSLIMYTPLNFYGFQFAWLLNFKAGMVARNNENLFNQPIYTGIGINLLIRNENLIFTNIVLSAYLYPNPLSGKALFNGFVNEGFPMTISNFNVSSPYTESLRN